MKNYDFDISWIDFLTLGKKQKDAKKLFSTLE